MKKWLLRKLRLYTVEDINSAVVDGMNAASDGFNGIIESQKQTFDALLKKYKHLENKQRETK